MEKILFVSHCVLNTASKIFYNTEKIINKEQCNRVKFLNQAAENGVQLIQLPCPEFLMYGSDRWGHSKDQFDNPFFKEKCREILIPYLLQMKEYLKNKERFEVLGIIGIDGSPSCGIDTSFCANWGGELSRCQRLDEKIKRGTLKKEKGVFMETLSYMLVENKINIPMTALKQDVLLEFLL
ncbi:hypothetical protein NSA24_04235 [Clostridioides mangenotii]|uniref:CD3072 family TudS-related putative desulfidase n=1 Tax=Metaclostridioides mangenotii TaxID=1540 RepID=UPI00214A3F8D|nr:hypothetical protein [Clostridioides mangenotii]